MTLDRLRRIVEDNDTRAGRAFDVVIQVLIVVSVLGFSFETLPDLGAGTRLFLAWIEVGCVAVFTIEYLLRLLVARHRLRFVFSFYGIVDLLAILPFYLALTIDLRTIRLLRMLRLLRILKMGRYSVAVRRFHSALLVAREELVLFLLATCALLYMAAAGIYYFERDAQPEKFQSVFHSLWWAVTTLTTVGYGDVYPVTIGGRIFTFVILMLGLGMVSVPTGIISAALTSVRRREEAGRSPSDQTSPDTASSAP